MLRAEDSDQKADGGATIPLSSPAASATQPAPPLQKTTPPPPEARASRRARLAATARRAAIGLIPAALWRGHRLITIVVLLALVPRVLAALAYRPALLSADSFLYMQGASTGRLGVIRPSGYSFFLALVGWLPHPLLVVTALQHLMGLAAGVIVYALLRRRGLPGWGAALAALPILFDPREIALESYILPDTLFMLVVVAVAAVLLSRRVPAWWQCGLAGLLLAYACILRGNGLPLAIVAGIYLLIRRAGWRAVTAVVAAVAIPVLGYVLAFHAQYDRYSLTMSDGLFLWSRTTSFADCAVIQPPARLRPLCPGRETSVPRIPARSWSVSHLLSEPTPSDYLWAPDVWWRTDAHPGIDSYNNQLGRDFARDAIEAQPLDYLRAAGRDLLVTFAATDRPQGNAYMTFTRQPRIASLPWYYHDDIRAYAGTTSNTRAVDPWVYFVLLYQQPVFFPGLVFALVVLAGLTGVIRDWRRWGGEQALPWALAAVSILSPALLTQSLYRYVIVAIPLSCLAAGLALTARRPRPAAEPGPAVAAACPAPASTGRL